MSGADGQELPGLDTFPGLVLTLTALSGELPAALVRRLPPLIPIKSMPSNSSNGTIFCGYSTVMASAAFV